MGHHIAGRYPLCQVSMGKKGFLVISPSINSIIYHDLQIDHHLHLYHHHIYHHIP